MSARRLGVIVAAALVVAASESRAQVNARPCSPVEVVSFRLNYLGRPLRDTEKLLVAIRPAGAPSATRTDVAPNAGNWFIDLADVIGVGAISATEVQATATPAVKPDVAGWQFGLKAGGVAIRLETIQGRQRCVARLLFDAAPSWRLRVTALPNGIGIPVSCGEPCRSTPTTEYSLTNFDTKPMSASERLRFVVYAETPCSYPIVVSPADMLPKKIPRSDIVDAMLRPECDIDERVARSIKVPSEIQISN